MDAITRIEKAKDIAHEIYAITVNSDDDSHSMDIPAAAGIISDALESLQSENEALKIDASNHAADAETVRRERDTLIAQRDRLLTRLELGPHGEDAIDVAESASALFLHRIDGLDQAVKKMAEALNPFAKAADVKLCGEWGDDERFAQTDVGFYLNFGDLRRARAALSAQVQDVAILDGWQLVPKEPTEEMLAGWLSGFAEATDHDWKPTEECPVTCWSYMLAAAPAAKQGDAE